MSGHLYVPVTGNPETLIGAPMVPPAEWHDTLPAGWRPDINLDDPVTYIDDQGRYAVFLCPYGVCLIEPDRWKGVCWTAPLSQTGYNWAHAGKVRPVLEADGSHSARPIANLAADVPHANQRSTLAGRRMIFDDTSKRVAQGTIRDMPEYGGIYVLGSLVPKATVWTGLTLQASGLSGEWFPRPDLPELELMGAITVNELGFRREIPTQGVTSRATHRFRVASAGGAVISGWEPKPITKFYFNGDFLKIRTATPKVKWTEEVVAEREEDGHVVPLDRALGSTFVENMWKASEEGIGPDYVDLALFDISDTHRGVFSGMAGNVTSREDMPQIPGDRFDEFAAAVGGLTPEALDPTQLQGIQRDLNGVKVGGMIAAKRRGTVFDGPAPLISVDDRVIDGHHRWAADALLFAAGEIPAMAALRSTLGSVELLAAAHKFAKSIGEAGRDVRDVKTASSESVAVNHAVDVVDDDVIALRIRLAGNTIRLTTGASTPKGANK